MNRGLPRAWLSPMQPPTEGPATCGARRTGRKSSAFPEKVDALVQEGKPKLAKDFQDFAGVIDSAGLCIFSFRGIWKDDMVVVLNQVLGLDLDMEEMLKIGERIWNLERLFNIAAGYERDG